MEFSLFDDKEDGEHNGPVCGLEKISKISAAQGRFFFGIEPFDQVLCHCLFLPVISFQILPCAHWNLS